MQQYVWKLLLRQIPYKYCMWRDLERILPNLLQTLTHWSNLLIAFHTYFTTMLWRNGPRIASIFVRLASLTRGWGRGTRVLFSCRQRTKSSYCTYHRFVGPNWGTRPPASEPIRSVSTFASLLEPGHQSQRICRVQLHLLNPEVYDEAGVRTTPIKFNWQRPKAAPL